MDWKQIIADLIDRGVTQPEIATKCGCSQASISDLATGKTKQPRFDLGASLIKQHGAAKRQARRKPPVEA